MHQHARIACPGCVCVCFDCSKTFILRDVRDSQFHVLGAFARNFVCLPSHALSSATIRALPRLTATQYSFHRTFACMRKVPMLNVLIVLRIKGAVTAVQADVSAGAICAIQPTSFGIKIKTCSRNIRARSPLAQATASHESAPTFSLFAWNSSAAFSDSPAPRASFYSYFSHLKSLYCLARLYPTQLAHFQLKFK